VDDRGVGEERRRVAEEEDEAHQRQERQERQERGRPVHDEDGVWRRREDGARGAKRSESRNEQGSDRSKRKSR